MKFKETAIVEDVQMNHLRSGAGLGFAIYQNGSVHSIRHEATQLNLFKGSLLQAGCSNIYLRIRGEEIISVPLIGPNSPGDHYFGENCFGVKGRFNGISFSCRLVLDDRSPCWFWQIHLENNRSEAVQADLIYVQDVGLIPAENGEYNELYISQYIDYTALDSQQYGRVICCRQNEHASEHVPWVALGSMGHADSFSTDGISFLGTQYRLTGVPEGLSLAHLPGLLQKETAIVAIQEKPFNLKPQESRQCTFFGVYCEHHELQTDLTDLDMIHSRLARFHHEVSDVRPETCVESELPRSLFSECDLWSGEDLTDDDLEILFAGQKRHCEQLNGELLSFYYGPNHHVVLKRKEVLVERPHGHIMKSGSSLVPTDSVMSSTAYMYGVFHSHVCQGNVNFNRFLTVNKSPFNRVRYTGERVFIELAGRYHQLAVPSAFEMGLNSCRWIYKRDGLLFEIVAGTHPDRPEVSLRLHVIDGPQLRWLITNELESTHGWTFVQPDMPLGKDSSVQLFPSEKSRIAQLYPGGFFEMHFENPEYVKRIGGDERLFSDGKSRGLSFVVVEVERTKDFTLRLCGHLVNHDVSSVQADRNIEGASEQFSICPEMGLGLRVCRGKKTDSRDMDEIVEMLPWFAQNAKIHYLTPHGLEQYGGAAWGTRDICQGPLEMLLSLGHYQQAKDVLCRIFSNQNPDGNWPQWWMFDRYRQMRCSHAHGDVILWPILALSEYLIASGDDDFLETELPFYSDGSSGHCRQISVMDHVLKCFEHIEQGRFTNGSSLMNYSEGDWNDAMQPANPRLKDRLISSWTVALSFQAFRQFAAACRTSGRNSFADKIESRCNSIQSDFNKLLVKDDVVAGFGYLNEWHTMDLLLHPSDTMTGIYYRLLPMIRGIISGIFSPRQAQHHSDLIEQYLKGPDGARLMDRPPRYHGGIQQFFKRAESSPYFGREIGLMYTHAHLRYAEALAKLGHAEEFVKALRQVIPIRIQEMIPQASLRQSNCYYSSSDAQFKSRYEVDERYADIQSGKVTLNGGWRIYSSGPGIVVRLIVSHLFGIRHAFGKLIFDPVLPSRFNGLTVQMDYGGRPVTLEYKIGRKQQGVTRIVINSRECPFDREANPYRLGGAMIEDERINVLMDRTDNRIEIIL